MNKKRLIKVLCSVFCILSVLACVAIAAGAEGTTPTPGEELTTFNSSIVSALSAFSTTNLGIVLVAALGITVTLVLAWFAYRFITRRVSKAMRKGSL